MPTTSLGFRYPATTDAADGPTAFNNLASDVDSYLTSHAINDRRWVRGSTASAYDDEFNNASLDSAWVRVDASGGTSRATWTEGADSLSLLLNGSDAAAELHALVRPYALAVGESIQTHITWSGPGFNYPLAGLIVSDGTTYASGTQAFAPLWMSNTAGAYSMSDVSTWTGFNTRAANTDRTSWGLIAPVHWKLTRGASNVWSLYVSADAVSWALFATRTIAFTPSHIGFAGSTWTGSSPFTFSFDYFRVV